MKKFRRLDQATAPDGTPLTLYEHDGEFAIRVANGVELMSTRRHYSEDKLAEVVCEPLRETSAARVLIGGLGLGFTLKAALQVLGADARVVVAEIVGKVIEWNRNPDYPLAGAALADPRVDLRHADVADVLAASPGEFDAIMLDVDNGADSLTTRENSQLYGDAGIQTAMAALRKGGRLAYWSVGEDARFVRALRRAGLRVETVDIPIYPGSKHHHTLFIAR